MHRVTADNGEKAWRQLHKNVTNKYWKQTHKRVTIRSLTSHLKTMKLDEQDVQDTAGEVRVSS